MRRDEQRPTIRNWRSGFPHTLSEDAAVIGQVPVTRGIVVPSRPIGVLIMEDEMGTDEKILCVPVDDLHPSYADIASYRELPEILRDQVAHFFTHYKDLETGKWIKVNAGANRTEPSG